VAWCRLLFLANWQRAGGAPAAVELGQRTSVEGRDLVRFLLATGGQGKVSPIRVAYGLAIANAAEHRYARLLEAGVRVFESRDTMVHAKTAVIGGTWSTDARFSGASGRRSRASSRIGSDRVDCRTNADGLFRLLRRQHRLALVTVRIRSGLHGGVHFLLITRDRARPASGGRTR
jgi:hypothetical protein